jgi:hypothetical protein
LGAALRVGAAFLDLTALFFFAFFAGWARRAALAFLAVALARVLPLVPVDFGFGRLAALRVAIALSSTYLDSYR